MLYTMLYARYPFERPEDKKLSQHDRLQRILHRIIKASRTAAPAGGPTEAPAGRRAAPAGGPAGRALASAAGGGPGADVEGLASARRRHRAVCPHPPSPPRPGHTSSAI